VGSWDPGLSHRPPEALESYPQHSGKPSVCNSLRLFGSFLGLLCGGGLQGTARMHEYPASFPWGEPACSPMLTLAGLSHCSQIPWVPSLLPYSLPYWGLLLSSPK
jgi:hypothetical protein